jgi:hypothetical protein
MDPFKMKVVVPDMLLAVDTLLKHWGWLCMTGNA